MEEAIVISPLDEMMETALVKANVTDTVISTLKSKYGGLKLRSVDDKEKYLEIKEAKRDCAKLRNLAVKICKEGRDEANKVSKKWVAKEKEVVGKIEEVEMPLDAEIERFDADVKRKEEEEKQRQETQYMQRTQALTKIGALYSDNAFTLGDFTLEANLVKESSQEVWDDEILPKFNEQYFILEAERIEQERVKAEKEAELKRQQDELAKQQREFQEQQAEFKRQMEEKARIEKEKLDKEHEEKRKIRSAQLSKMGMNYNGNSFVFSDVNIHWSELMSKTEAEWNETIEKITPIIEERKAEQQKKQQEEIEKQKAQAAEAAAQAERERIAEENRQAEIKRQADEQRKAEELAKAGDKAIWADFIQKIEKIEYPKLKSGQYKKIGNIAVEKLNEILQLKPY